MATRTPRWPIAKLLGFGRDRLDVVEGNRLGDVLHQIQYVIHIGDQPVNLLAVEWRDESLVQQAVNFLRHTVSRTLSVVHILVEFFTLHWVSVVFHQIGKGVRGHDDVVGVLIEQLKKIALTGQQLSEDHGFDSRVTKVTLT